MTDYLITTTVVNQTAPTIGGNYDADDLLGLDDTLFVAATGALYAVNQLGDGIHAYASGEAITLEGSAYSAHFSAVAVGGADTALVVDGSANGYTAVSLAGNADTVNIGATGRLNAQFIGLGFFSAASAPTDTNDYATNAGVISGAFGLVSTDAGGSTISNSGTIQASNTGLDFEKDAGTDYVVNSGMLSGETAVASYQSASSGVSVTNSGHIAATGVGARGGVYTGALYFDDALGVTDYVANTGDIAASVFNAAIYAVYDNVNVTNAGKIVGGLSELSGGVATISNSGLWDTAGYFFGLQLGAAGGALTNTGTIVGNVSGAGGATVNNSGAISGSLTLSGSAGGDHVVNSGSVGAVTLGSGIEWLTNAATGDVLGDVNLFGFDHLNNGGVIGGNTTLATGAAVNNGRIDGGFAFSGTGSASLVNRGSIAGGVSITQATAASVVNSVKGTIGAPAVSGGDTTGPSPAAVTIGGINGTLSNAGSIDGGVALGAQATFKNLGAIAGDVNQASGTALNAGTISGGFASGVSALTNSGTIGSGVSLSAAADLSNTARGDIGKNSASGVSVTFQHGGRLTNAGVAEGDVSFGAASDSVVNSGQIHGAVTMVAGSAHFTNTGTVDSTVTTTGTAAGDTVSNSGVLNAGLNLGGTTSLLFGDVVNNWARGSIVNGVALGGDWNVVTNAGSLTGGIAAISYHDSLSNTGTLAGGVSFVTPPSGSAGFDTVFNGARGSLSGDLNFAGADDKLTNLGSMDGTVRLLSGLDVVVNSGALSGGVIFSSGIGGDQLSNLRTLTGDVTMSGPGSKVVNSGTISGSVTLGADDVLTDTGQIQTDLGLGAGDSVMLGRGGVTGVIHAAANDAINFNGLMGQTSIAGFQSTDTIGFNTAVFANYTALHAAMTQVGADVRITRDNLDWITLKGETLAALTSSNFTFA